MADYVTLSEAKNSSELIGTNFADYDLQMAISAASQAIDLHCDRTFTSDAAGSTSVRYYSALDFGPNYLLLEDLISVSTVAMDQDGDGTFETVWVNNTDYVLEPLNAVVNGIPFEKLRIHPASRQVFPAWPRAISVSGQHGWPNGPPAVVRQATIILSLRLLKRAREAPFGVAGLGIDGGVVRISTTDPDVALLLDRVVRGDQVLAS